MVPGLCVSTYLRPACDALALAGFDVRLASPAGWPRAGSPTDEPRSVADLAGPIAQWFAADDISGVTLVGQSVGAQVAAHVAALAPTRVARLVLQGPVFDPTQRSMARAMWHWLADIPRERPALMVAEVPDWAVAGPRRISRTLRMALADRLEATLDSLAPDLVVDVVVGEHDPLSTRVWTASLVRNGRLVVLPGLPHSSPHADPTGFARVMTELVAGAAIPAA